MDEKKATLDKIIDESTLGSLQDIKASADNPIEMTAEQDTIQKLVGVLNAVFAETTDEASKALIHATLEQIGGEYLQDTNDPNSLELFQSLEMTKKAREAIRFIRVKISGNETMNKAQILLPSSVTNKKVRNH